MKNNSFLLALFLTLTATTAFSQQQLPASLRPYAVNLTYTLVKSLHRAGYDMPTMAARPVHQGVSQRNVLQLDSTKTYFGYNLNGPGDSTPLSRTIFTYPSDNVKVEADYQYENGAWTPLSRSTFISDSQKRLVEVLAETFDPGSQGYVPDSRLEIFPHGDSPELKDSVFTYAWDTVAMDWAPFIIIKNTFDDQNRLQESLSQVNYLGDPLVFQDVYSYDANGDNHLIESFIQQDGAVFPTERSDLAYADHLLIEIAVSSFDGVGFQPQSRANYAYTLFGALRLIMNFEWDAAINNYRMIQRIEYAYDNAQRLSSEETTFMNPNAADERYLKVYAYIQDENLSQEMGFFWDDDLFDWILDTKKHYYYNGLSVVDPLPGVARDLAAWPNPTVGVVQLTLESDASVQVFDLAGQLVQSRQMQPGQALDLSALPAGLYVVTALQGADYYTGRIVKQ